MSQFTGPQQQHEPSTGASTPSSMPQTPVMGTSRHGAPAAPSVSASPSSSPVAASISDSSADLMWEEQLRVAAASLSELHQLVTQRRKGTQAQQGQGHRQAREAHTTSLAYHSLSDEQAHSLTSHLLLTSHTLLHQLSQQWTSKHGGGTPFTCPCTRESKRAAGAEESGSAEQPSPSEQEAASSSAVSPAASTDELGPPSPPSLPSVSIRRTVLPFSNISLLERNIMGLRNEKGKLLRQNSGASASPIDTPYLHLDNGSELAHPRDVQLLHAHFTQLLACPSPPLSLQTVHPYGIVFGEFLRYWKQQARFVSNSALRSLHSSSHASADEPFGTTVAASAAAAVSASSSGVVVDLAFLQSQLSSLFTFLSNHETLFLLSYPHLHHTSLCKTVLRSCMRGMLLDHPVVFRALHGWARQVYAEEERALAMQINDMKHVTLSQIGLLFPYNLVDVPLVDPSARVGEGIEGEGASTRAGMRQAKRASSDDGYDEYGMSPLPPPLDVRSLLAQEMDAPVDDSDAQSPIDTLIHSDDEGDGMGGERGALQGRNRHEHARRRRLSEVKRNQSRTGTLSGHASSSPPRSSGSGSGVSQLSISTTAAVIPLPHQHSDGSNPASTPSPSSRSLPLPSAPYSRSIALLSTLDSVHTVAGKLGVLVSTCRCVAEELNEFVRKHGMAEVAPTDASAAAAHDDSNVGASGMFALTCDDLFQIFSYLLLHAQLESPLSTFSLLAECIDNAALSGEAGYALTSAQCAVQLILGWGSEGPQTHPAQAQAQAQAHVALHMRSSPSLVPCTPPMASSSTSSSSSSSLADAGTPSALATSASFTHFLGGGAPGSYSLSGPLASAKGRTAISAGNTPVPASPGRSSSRPTLFGSPSFSLSPSPPPALPDPSVYSALLASQLDAFCIAADYLVADSAWQWLYDKEGVSVTRKLYPESPIHSIKGVATIHRPIDVVFSFLRNIHNRVHIDEIFSHGRVLQHLSTDSRIVQYFFRARHWCSRMQSDMVLLHHTAPCSDGVSRVVLAFSVSHPLAPSGSNPAFSRATVRASGWLLKPEPGAGGRATRCTYIVAPDANGFPAWIVNMLSTKQPMILRVLEEHLQAHTSPAPSPKDVPNAAGAQGTPAASPTSPHRRNNGSAMQTAGIHKV